MGIFFLQCSFYWWVVLHHRRPAVKESPWSLEATCHEMILKKESWSFWTSFRTSAAQWQCPSTEVWIQEIQLHHPAGWSIHSGSKTSNFKRSTATFTSREETSQLPAEAAGRPQKLTRLSLSLSGAWWLCLLVTKQSREDKPAGASNCPEFSKGQTEVAVSPPARPLLSPTTATDFKNLKAKSRKSDKK